MPARGTATISFSGTRPHRDHADPVGRRPRRGIVRPGVSNALRSIETRLLPARVPESRTNSGRPSRPHFLAADETVATREGAGRSEPPCGTGRRGLMSRELADARRWMRQGTALLLRQADLANGDLSQHSALPGWTRGHLIAHVAANADALGNLVHWPLPGNQPRYTPRPPIVPLASRQAAGCRPISWCVGCAAPQPSSRRR